MFIQDLLDSNILYKNNLASSRTLNRPCDPTTYRPN